MEHQRGVDEYRNAMNERRDLIPLESNMFKTDLAVISHIMYMMDMDNFWHQKTFGAVLAELQRNHDEKSMNKMSKQK